MALLHAVGALAALLIVAVLATLFMNSITIVICLVKFRHIPGPMPHLVWGNALEMTDSKGGRHVYLQKMSKKYGPVFKVFLLSRMAIVVADPDAARTVLYKFANRPSILLPTQELIKKKEASPLDKCSLLEARDGYWRMLRTAWQPAFAPGALARYTPHMLDGALQLCNMLRGACLAGDVPAETAGCPFKHLMGGAGTAPAPGVLASKAAAAAPIQASADGYVDLNDLLGRLTMQVVGTCAYGVDFHCLTSVPEDAVASEPTLESVGPALVHASREFVACNAISQTSKWAIAAAVAPGPLKPAVIDLAQAFPDAALRRTVASRQTVMRASTMLIDDFTTKQAAGITAEADAAAPANGHALGGMLPGSFLSLMLHARAKGESAPLDNGAVVAQANLFLLAGTETTSNTMAFAVRLLAQHPEVLSKVQAELDAFGDNPITPEDKLPWLEAVIFETQRLMPTATTVMRELGGNVSSINVCGYTINGEGIRLLVPIYSIHRDATLWPKADEFMPERWFTENEAELGPRHPNAFLPFGGGTRMCPGWKFARQEMKLALAALYKDFTFEFEPGQDMAGVVSAITMAPATLRVRPVPRRAPAHAAC